MKYYSEVVKKLFDTQDELESAEKAANEKKEKDAAKKALISKEKKACADAIKAAESDLDEVREKYNAAKKEAQEIIDRAHEDAKKIISEASKELIAAQEKKCEALKDFNAKYGPYTVSYTGEKAYSEYKKAVDNFNELFFRFF